MSEQQIEAGDITFVAAAMRDHGVTRYAIEKAVRNGAIRAINLPGDKLMVSASDCKAYFTSSKVAEAEWDSEDPEPPGFNRGIEADRLRGGAPLPTMAAGWGANIQAVNPSARSYFRDSNSSLPPHVQKSLREFGEAMYWVGAGWQRPKDRTYAIDERSDIKLRTLLDGGVTRAVTPMAGYLGGQSGAFLIKPAWVEAFFAKARLYPTLAKIEFIPTVKAREGFYPTSFESSRATGQRNGGLQAFWRGEGSAEIESLPTFDASDASLGIINYTVKRLMAYLTFSRDLDRGFFRVCRRNFKADRGRILLGAGVGRPDGQRDEFPPRSGQCSEHCGCGERREPELWHHFSDEYRRHVQKCLRSVPPA